MKRKFLIALGLLVGIGFLFTATAHALNAQRGDTLTLDKDKVVDASIYRFGKNITIAGVVRGDVYCAGQHVEISGTVEGDVLCAGQEVRISGRVQGDVRVAGQNVFLTGQVAGSATVGGQTVNIEQSASIGRDLTLGSQTVYLAGKVNRDVSAAGSVLTVAAQIGRSTDLAADNVTLTDKAHIKGDFMYHSRNNAEVQQGAVVEGRTDHKTPPPKEASKRPKFGSGFMSPLYWALSMLAAGIAALLLMPRWFKNTGTLMQQKILSTLGIGLVGLLVTPILVALLMVTIIGIPLGLTLLVFWVMALLASFTFTAFALGTWILTHLEWLEKGRNFAALLLGVLLVVVLVHVPFLGFWFGLLALLWGLGGITLALMRGVRAQHQKPMAKTKKHAKA